MSQSELDKYTANSRSLSLHRNTFLSPFVATVGSMCKFCFIRAYPYSSSARNYIDVTNARRQMISNVDLCELFSYILSEKSAYNFKIPHGQLWLQFYVVMSLDYNVVMTFRFNNNNNNNVSWLVLRQL